jgi:multiple sugar transport system ATP-binding protein
VPRPEDLAIVESDRDAIQADIYVVEPIGESTIVDLKIGRYLAKARAPAGFKKEIGEKVFVRIAGDQIHLFDKRNEKALM